MFLSHKKETFLHLKMLTRKVKSALVMVWRNKGYSHIAE